MQFGPRQGARRSHSSAMATTSNAAFGSKRRGNGSIYFWDTTLGSARTIAAAPGCSAPRPIPSKQLRANAATQELTVYRNVGGNFAAAPPATAQSVGRATLTFASCGEATLSYSFTDGSSRKGSIDLQRLAPKRTCTTETLPPPTATSSSPGSGTTPPCRGRACSSRSTTSSRSPLWLGTPVRRAVRLRVPPDSAGIPPRSRTARARAM